MQLSEQWLYEMMGARLSAQDLLEKLVTIGIEIDACHQMRLDPSARYAVLTVQSVQAVGEIWRYELREADGTIQVLEERGHWPVGTCLLMTWVPGQTKPTVVHYHQLGLECDDVVILPQSSAAAPDLGVVLNLPDNSLNLKIAANRGDCMSVMGLAREIAAIADVDFTPPAVESVLPAVPSQIRPLRLATPLCPYYVGCVVEGIAADAQTPLYIQERLRRSGIRPVSFIVDITQYVMLECGQPLHAFADADLQGELQVRLSQPKEAVRLLDGKDLILSEPSLVVADERGIVALAGIMGAERGSVRVGTQRIFLEAAYFDPVHIRLTARRHKLITDASVRFERGVDIDGVKRALERACALLVELSGASVKGWVEAKLPEAWPEIQPITLRQAEIGRKLGIELEAVRVEQILGRLGCRFKRQGVDWTVEVPTWRSDLRFEMDLIEELARFYGFEHIPAVLPAYSLRPTPANVLESSLSLKRQLAARGYQEVITYSFISPEAAQSVLRDNEIGVTLLNPISHEMSVMRPSLWPGLLQTVAFNHRRQQSGLRFFEIGTCFSAPRVERQHLSAILCGPAYPAQWGLKGRPADIYDLKGDIQVILDYCQAAVRFEPAEHPALDPIQSAVILDRDGQQIGYMGAIHPRLLKLWDIPPCYIIELEMSALERGESRHFKEVSRFPSIRRDVALLVNKDLWVSHLQASLVAAGGAWLQSVQVFDVYEGKGIPAGQKSVALSLVLQHPERTLVEEEVNVLVHDLLQAVKREYGAVLRE